MKKGRSAAHVVLAQKAFGLEAEIKRALRAHFQSLGFEQKDGELTPPGTGKDIYRQLHREHRSEKLNVSDSFVEEKWRLYQGFFASGDDVRPQEISPNLELVKKESWQSELFRLASLTWSVPVSQGYGRRLRFLVWDKSTNKLMGIFALGDPVFNLSARDRLIGWSSNARKERLVNILDAFVLGALPPYNQLLGGKLVSCLIKSREVHDAFEKKYGQSTGIISQKQKHAQLVAVTTTSSLGRSSIYNRLRIGDENYFERIGFTLGFGHFQVPKEIFHLMRKLMEEKGHKYAKGYKFGAGPNWRMRLIRAALNELGLSSQLLKHNLQREVFLCRIANNTDAFLRGEEATADFKKLKSVEEISEACKSRWIAPRAKTKPGFKSWSVKETHSLLKQQKVDLTESFEPNVADGSGC